MTEEQRRQIIHSFYCVNEASQNVEVLRFWHSARREPAMTLIRVLDVGRLLAIYRSGTVGVFPAQPVTPLAIPSHRAVASAKIEASAKA